MPEPLKFEPEKIAKSEAEKPASLKLQSESIAGDRINSAFKAMAGARDNSALSHSIDRGNAPSISLEPRRTPIFASQLELYLREGNDPAEFNKMFLERQLGAARATGLISEQGMPPIGHPDTMVNKVYSPIKPVDNSTVKPIDRNNEHKTKPDKDTDGSKKLGFDKWKESHPCKLSDWEKKFCYLVDDFRAHPEKYKSWYRAADKRTGPVRDLKPSEKLSKEAAINTRLMQSKGLGHWGPAGYEIAFAGAGSPESALKAFLNSSAHREHVENGKFRYFGVSREGSRVTMRFR